MYKQHFGTKGQINFETENDYYEFLGYLAKNDGTTNLVWERNDEQGAWAQEGRIQFFDDPPNELNANLQLTAGVGSIAYRVNCNDFLDHIRDNHDFVLGLVQDQDAIRSKIPAEFEEDFERGLGL